MSAGHVQQRGGRLRVRQVRRRRGAAAVWATVLPEMPRGIFSAEAGKLFLHTVSGRCVEGRGAPRAVAPIFLFYFWPSFHFPSLSVLHSPLTLFPPISHPPFRLFLPQCDDVGQVPRGHGMSGRLD